MVPTNKGVIVITNEEYIKSLSGENMINYFRHVFTDNELYKYVNWEEWLKSEKRQFIYKGVFGQAHLSDGMSMPCIVVQKEENCGVKYCTVILRDEKEKPYVYNLLAENVECPLDIL